MRLISTIAVIFLSSLQLTYSATGIKDAKINFARDLAANCQELTNRTNLLQKYSGTFTSTLDPTKKFDLAIGVFNSDPASPNYGVLKASMIWYPPTFQQQQQQKIFSEFDGICIGNDSILVDAPVTWPSFAGIIIKFYRKPNEADQLTSMIDIIDPRSLLANIEQTGVDIETYQRQL